MLSITHFADLFAVSCPLAGNCLLLFAGAVGAILARLSFSLSALREGPPVQPEPFTRSAVRHFLYV
jgi:hypothetical protein